MTERAACVFALLLVAWPAHARAQEQETAKLDTVVVTATRIEEDALDVPAAIDVIDAADIHRANPKISLAETLEQVPGVVARERQNHAQDLQISIRGFGARSTFGVRGVRLYTDGIPATMPDGQGQVSHFALENAARIEVLRGPFSALYGNSSGGVISLFTAGAPAEPEFTGGLVAGDFGQRKSSLALRAPWGESRDGDLLIDVTDFDTDGYREHSAAERRNGQLLLKGRFGASGRYTLLGNWLDLDALDPQGLTGDQLREDRRAASQGALAFDTRKTVEQNQFGAHLEHDLSSAHALAVTLYDGNRKTTQMLSIPVFVQQGSPLQGGGAIHLDRDYRGADARWRWEADLWSAPFSLTTGIAHEVSDEIRHGYENFIGDDIGVFGALRRDENNRVTSRDVYVQADWQPADRWRINVGARRSEITFTSNDRFITAENPDDSGELNYARTSPVAGVLFHVTPELSAYANIGGGFETPTFSELVYRNDAQSGLNDTLDPATSANIELGVRARHGEMKWSAAVFHSRTEDELIVVANEGGRSVYGNAGVSRRRGIEFAASGNISTHWRFASAWTFLDARYLEGFSEALDGHRIPGLSRHFAWSEITWSPFESTRVILEGRFTDRVYVNDENDESASAYASFDLGAEQRLDTLGIEWRGFARVNNLFDREYVGSVIVNEGNRRYYEPAPGRHWMIGITGTHTFK